MPGIAAAGRPPGPQPVREQCRRGGAKRSRLDPIRLNSAKRGAGAARVWVSLFQVVTVAGARRPGERGGSDRLRLDQVQEVAAGGCSTGQGVEEAPGV